MAPAVLCLLLFSVLQLCSVNRVSATGLAGPNVQFNRKLFADDAPTDNSVAVNDPTTLTPVSKPTASPAKAPPKTPAPTTKTKPVLSASKVPPPPVPWYLGGSTKGAATFAGYSYDFPQDVLNFTEAEKYCQKNYKKGHLVSIHSQAQHDFLNEKFVQGTAINFLSVLVPSIYPTGDGVGHRGVWIGLRSTDSSTGPQGWTDGTAYDFDAFYKGKPDNWQGIESCVQIYGDTTPVGWSGFWDDIACEAKMRFICAWPVVGSSDAYPVYNGSEYIFHSELTDWETAESTCWKLDGGHLASMHSQQQADWIYQTFVFPKKLVDFAVELPEIYQQSNSGNVGLHRGIWIGLNLQLGVPFWTDFTPYDFKNWAPSEPDNWNNVEFCTSLYVDAAPKGYAQKWDDLACEAQQPFLCSRKLNTTDQVYPQYKGWEYIMINDALTWMDGNKSCVEKFDAQVASFDSEEELNFVYKQYFQIPSNNYPVLLPDIYTDPANRAAINQSYVGIGRRGVWIGLINQDGTWKWSDGSATTMQHWIPGKPDNFQGSESCTQLYIDDNPKGWASYWDDLACTAKCSVICKRKPRKAAVQAPLTAEDPYASDAAFAFLNRTVGQDAVFNDKAVNTTGGEGRTKLSQGSIIGVAVVGSFIGALVIASIAWRLLRPPTPEEEDPAVGVAATGAAAAVTNMPNQYKGKAKASGVVHAPTGAGRLPPSKTTVVKEVRPSKYVKIDVEDLEVPPEQFTFQPPQVPLDQPQHEVMNRH